MWILYGLVILQWIEATKGKFFHAILIYAWFQGHVGFYFFRILIWSKFFALSKDTYWLSKFWKVNQNPDNTWLKSFPKQMHEV